MSHSHLNENTIPLLDLNDEERIEKIRSPRWIGYPQAKQIITKLEDLLGYPQSHRMPNLLIVGDTNNGKTMLVSRFRAQHPCYDNPHGIVAPTLMVQAPLTSDEDQLYNAILHVMFASYNHPHARVEKKQFKVIRLMRYIGVRMLIIDEIHHILVGDMNRQKTFLNVIKYLGNELQIPIVGICTKDAFRALQADQQLSNRFEPAVLPRWELDKEFLRLLMSFERMIPLAKASNLHEANMAARLYAMSEGYIGELSRILNEAAVIAVQTQTENINAAILDALHWVSPSDRKRQLDKLLFE